MVTFGGLKQYNIINTTGKPMNTILGMWWDDRRRWGVVASGQQVVHSRQKMTDDIKAFARANGAALVGVTLLRDENRFEEFNDPYKYAISVAVPMDRESMAHTPTELSSTEIQHIYREIGLIASVTEPFCGDCTRARVSADGHLFTCLFAQHGTDLRPLLRSGADDAALAEKVATVWSLRGDRYSELRAALPAARKVEMSAIGG